MRSHRAQQDWVGTKRLRQRGCGQQSREGATSIRFALARSPASRSDSTGSAHQLRTSGMQNVLVQIASGDSLRPFGPNVNVHSTPYPSRSLAKNRRGVLENEAKSIAWLRSSYLNLESSYLDLGRDLAKLVYGHDINHVLLLHLGAFSSTILPDALNLQGRSARGGGKRSSI